MSVAAIRSERGWGQGKASPALAGRGADHPGYCPQLGVPGVGAHVRAAERLLRDSLVLGWVAGRGAGGGGRSRRRRGGGGPAEPRGGAGRSLALAGPALGAR